MPGEKETIAILNGLLPQGRRNRAHEADCEVIELEGKPYLFTTDEFSAEDRFFEENPRLLGWNIAVGALSDIYACGGKPLYYAHALTIAKTWSASFIEDFGRGIAEALKISGARFIGGDCGQAEAWRCCATVIGVTQSRVLTRRGATAGDAIYISGRIGGGNLQAAFGMVPFARSGLSRLARVKFRLRHRESETIAQFASACIDTSDGVWSALTTLADLNGCGYALDMLPYHRAGAIVARAVSLPQLLLFLAECGEYELLCTIPAHNERAFRLQAHSRGLHFFRIGSITADGRVVSFAKEAYDLSSLRIEARSFASSRDYLSALIDWIHSKGAIDAA